MFVGNAEENAPNLGANIPVGLFHTIRDFWYLAFRDLSQILPIMFFWNYLSFFEYVFLSYTRVSGFSLDNDASFACLNLFLTFMLSRCLFFFPSFLTRSLVNCASPACRVRMKKNLCMGHSHYPHGIKNWIGLWRLRLLPAM